MQELARVQADPRRARLYVEGWQSWSFTAPALLDSPPWRPRSRNGVTMDCQGGALPPEGTSCGSGLLALDPGDGGPVELFGAHSAAHMVPLVHLSWQTKQAVLSSDSPEALEHVSDAGPGGLAGALARFGERFSARAGVPELRSVPPVWCSWYQYFDSVTADDIESNLRTMDQLEVPAAVVQVDDGWESAVGDWLSVSARFGDLRAVLGHILDTGRRAGIWLAPLLVGRHSHLYDQHPDWVLKRLDRDEPVSAGQAVRDDCAVLDITQPQAAAHLRHVLSTLSSWGVDYFKLDFLYAGALPGRRCQPVTDVEAYRLALELARDAVGPEALLLGCGAPVLPSVGLVDAMRVGPDTAPTWYPDEGGESGDPSYPCQWGATLTSRARAWQHGRFWVNDADCLIVRPGIEQREQWARTVESYSGLRASSDDLASLDAWGLATTRRLLTPSSTGPFLSA
jgi:alpha-galactosidase